MSDPGRTSSQVIPTGFEPDLQESHRLAARVGRDRGALRQLVAVLEGMLRRLPPGQSLAFRAGVEVRLGVAYRALPSGDPDTDLRRAIACFEVALDDVGLTAGEPLHQVLHDYFAWATTNTMAYEESADDVPNGLAIPRWSWDGRQP